MSKKQRSLGVGLGSPPFQYLYVRSAFQDFQKVCLCRQFNIAVLLWKLEGLGGDFKLSYHYTFTVSQAWRLKLSHIKTVTAAFYLNNREAKCKLNVYNSNRLLLFCPAPIYLGVKLDRSLTFCHHLMVLCKKTIFARHTAEPTCGLKMGCWCQNTAYSRLISSLLNGSFLVY